MQNLYNKIYNAVNEGIQKALLIDPEQNDVSINYSYHKIDNSVEPLFEFIDLGLPSGTLWCNHNFGATCDYNPESWYGSYYTYDKIISQPDIIQLDLKKRNHVMAEKIKIPTQRQFDELKIEAYTIFEWVTNYNGIKDLNGTVFISKINNNFIFIPATGYFDINSSSLIENGDKGYLWSNTFDDRLSINKSKDWVWYFKIYNNGAFTTNGGDCRKNGLPVRAVCIKK